MRAEIIPGSTFPDYVLPGHTGRHRKLSELQEYLRAVLKKCRPGREITTAEMTAALAAGRKELFYSYRKTYPQTIRERQ